MITSLQCDFNSSSCKNNVIISQVCVLSVELVSRTRDSSTEREKHSYLEPLIRCTRKQQ